MNNGVALVALIIVGMFSAVAIVMTIVVVLWVLIQ